MGEDTEDNNASSLSLASSLSSASSLRLASSLSSASGLSSASSLSSASAPRFILSGTQGEDYISKRLHRDVKNLLDIDGDGSLTRKEMLRGLTIGGKELGLTYKGRQEMRAIARKSFKLFDKNGNGKLNSKESRRFFK